MFTPVDYDFSEGKSLSYYGLEETDLTFKAIHFDGHVLRLVTSDDISAELRIKTDAGSDGIRLKLKVKNAKGNASSHGNNLMSDSYVKTSTMTHGDVIISVNHGETFEFTGYSLAAD